MTSLWRSRPLHNPTAPLGTDATNAYLGGSDRKVVAVDLASGRTRWSVRVGGPVIGGVVLGDEVVYAGTDQPGGRVLALKKESGSELWSAKTGYIQAPLGRVAGRIIALNRNGLAVGIDERTGKVLWRRRLAPTEVAPVILADSNVLVSSFDSLYLLRPRDGEVLMRKHAPGTVVADWVNLGHRIVAGTGDSLLVALSADSLTESWRVHLDAPLLVSPAVRGDTIYCVTQLGTVYRVRDDSLPAPAVLDTVRWPATGTPSVVGSWLLVGGSDGRLHAFDTMTGAEQWTVTLGRPFEIAPLLLEDGTFLALGGRGDLTRMKP